MGQGQPERQEGCGVSTTAAEPGGDPIGSLAGNVPARASSSHSSSSSFEPAASSGRTTLDNLILAPSGCAFHLYPQSAHSPAAPIDARLE